MISEGATHAIVVAGAGKQGVDFLDGSLGTAEPELEHAAHRWRQLCLFEQLLNGLAIKRLHGAALILQPLQQPRDLVDPGDGAGGELGELGVDLGCRGLCNPARSFGELPIDMEAALVDPAAERPQRLFRSRQRRQPVMQLALYFDVLLDNSRRAAAADRRSSNQ